MVPRLPAAAGHWTATRLSNYPRDNDEHRALTRSLLHLGGTIAHGPAAITVTHDTPDPPRPARALNLLHDELSAAPPRIPGDTRPITCQPATTPTRI